jgi:hypothetical protein
MPTSDRPDSLGLTLRGKWGRGPSVEVTGRDSLLFLSLGSEVAIIDFANPDSPRVLSEVQALGLVSQAAIRDSFLYIGCSAGQSGIEVWNVADPTRPVLCSRTPSMLSDFCISDTFLYLTQDLSGMNDTFKVYSIGSPTSPRLLGTCRDSGACVTVTGNTALLGDRWGLYAVDVSNPANPHHVGSYPGMPIAVASRGNICCVTFGSPSQPGWLEFDVLNVSNPASISRLGYLSDAGGSDVSFDGSLVYLSGYFQGTHEFEVVSIADSTAPAPMGGCMTPGMNFGVWGDSARGMAYVADRTEGLAAIDVHNLTMPVYKAASLVAGVAEDVSVDGSKCYVADLDAGMKILDVTASSMPVEIGALDTVSSGLATFSAVARDSFAYVCWWPQPYLRVATVADPANPRIVAGGSVFAFPEDMVLRDSFLYVAMDYKFQVVNVARPREPSVAGSCNLPERSWKLVIRDSLAFVANLTSLQVLNVSAPSNPHVIGSWTGRALGVSLLDTFAYVASSYYGLKVLSVADPTTPVLLDSIPLEGWMDDVEVVGSVAYVAGWYLYALGLEDPVNPIEVARWTPPSAGIRRLEIVGPHLYAACTDGGVSILDTIHVGIGENGGHGFTECYTAVPNPTTGHAVLMLPDRCEVHCISAYDAAGKEVGSKRAAGESRVVLDMSAWPNGVYVLRIHGNRGTARVRVVKTGR